ncbi:elongation factor Ts, mitochondrial-like [Ptychodera flava]|uniref:elongation factor Ts, mitochondrial-like n=1 Tax=Ptychodera flava TaxID=63121 RepID=UPI00396A4EED
MFCFRNFHINTLCVRFFNTASIQNAVSKAKKSNLAKLRKKTGFSFANCKKALDKFENNLEKAEVWLKEQAQKEGWAKATKLQHRAMAQGLVGVLCEKNTASMVEVNCETDFVAKNDKFQTLVGQVAAVTINNFKHLSENNANHVKIPVSGEDLNKMMSTEHQKSLQELLVLAIGQLGENAAIRRAVYLSTPADVFIGNYVHSTLSTKDSKHKCVFGKYGALVAFKKTRDVGKAFNPTEFGRRLGQHIVGMSPTSIGTFDDEKEIKTEAKREGEEKDRTSEDQTDGDTEEARPTESWTIDETEMVKQEFLLDPSVKVGELLKEEGVEIVDFVRYQCGEELE